MHIADDAGRSRTVLVAPGEQREGVEVRLQVHVRLVDTDKALDGGTVEHDLAVQRLFNLAEREGDIFHEAENIHKLQPEKIDVFPGNNLLDFFSLHIIPLIVPNRLIKVFIRELIPCSSLPSIIKIGRAHV